MLNIIEATEDKIRGMLNLHLTMLLIITRLTLA